MKIVFLKCNKVIIIIINVGTYYGNTKELGIAFLVSKINVELYSWTSPISIYNIFITINFNI